MQAAYGEVGLDDNFFNSELNGGKGRNNKNKTLILNREAKIENQQFEMANSKGLELRNDNEQGDGNCEQMVGTFGQKAELSAKVFDMECTNEDEMEWNVECVETEPKKVKKKMKRVLPSWILEGKKQNLPDTEKIDSVKAEKINSIIEILFKNQEENYGT